MPMPGGFGGKMSNFDLDIPLIRFLML